MSKENVIYLACTPFTTLKVGDLFHFGRENVKLKYRLGVAGFLKEPFRRELSADESYIMVRRYRSFSQYGVLESCAIAPAIASSPSDMRKENLERANDLRHWIVLEWALNSALNLRVRRVGSLLSESGSVNLPVLDDAMRRVDGRLCPKAKVTSVSLQDDERVYVSSQTFGYVLRPADNFKLPYRQPRTSLRQAAL